MALLANVYLSDETYEKLMAVTEGGHERMERVIVAGLEAVAQPPVSDEPESEGGHAD